MLPSLNWSYLEDYQFMFQKSGVQFLHNLTVVFQAAFISEISILMHPGEHLFYIFYVLS